MHVRTQGIMILVGGMLLVASCSNKATSEILHHPSDMIRVDVGAEPPSMDPTISEDSSSGRIMYDLFEGLVDFDQQNNVIPGMASSWDLSGDNKTYTFHLRKGLKFSDGSPITAADFVYSWRRLVDPKTASNYSFLINSVVNANQIINSFLSPSKLGVEAPDDYTFIVHLQYPDVYFLQKILLTNAYVVPKKVIEKYGQAWVDPEHMISSGAYRLISHVVNGYVLAEKNPYYYNAKNVSIKQVKYFPYPDLTTTAQTYKAGGIDITFTNVPLDQYELLRKTYGSQVHTVPMEATMFYDINMKDPVFANNIKLRQALSMSIDRDILVNNVLHQGQKPLYSLVTDTVDSGAYAAIRYSWANLPQAKKNEIAKKLFKEAGYNVSHPLTFTVSYNTNDLNKRMTLSLVAMWKNVFGNAIQINLQNMEWKSFLAARHEGNYQIARGGWFADYNGVTTYTPLYECKNGQNDSHICDSRYDSLINQAVSISIPSLQIKLYKDALNVMLNDYSVIPLYQYTYTEMIKPYVDGYYPDRNYLEHIQTKWMRLSN